MTSHATRPSAACPSNPRPAISRAISRQPSWRHVLILLAALCSVAAGYGPHSGAIAVSANSCRSQNFVVEAPTPELARQLCSEAERFRKELALEWLGQELPAWSDICPIRVTVGPHLGAGGATSFTFINGQPRQWDMQLQGSAQRILDSVLPHEVTHTVLATHFGRPLPRWADEGAATSVEHASERSKQDRLLIEFLTTDRGIAFNHMFAMREYPPDILPLYSQGYSLARYLIAQGGKRKFIDYVGDGMRSNNWTAATQKHYSMRSLSELQVTWLDWVRQGSPASVPAVALAEHRQPVSNSPDEPSAAGALEAASGLVPLPSTARTAAPETHGARADSESLASANTSANPSDGWYSRRRDEAQGQASGTTTTLQPVRSMDARRDLATPSMLR